MTAEAGNRSLMSIYSRNFAVPACLVCSGALLIAGLFLPVLTLKEMVVMKSTFSILSGIANLWKEEQPFLAVIIVLFSVIFPTIKLCTLFLIWFAGITNEQRAKILRWLELLGKWSMLDVFVVAVTVVAVKFGFLIHAEPRGGIYVFASSILLAMATTMWMGKLVDRAASGSGG